MRVARLSRALGELELDGLLVDTLVNVRYLTGFTGSHALVLAVGDGGRARLGRHRFLTDFRYTTQSAEQVPDAFEREIVAGDLLEHPAFSLAQREGQSGRLGFDELQPDRQGARAAG